MLHYLIQFSYLPEAWATMIENPQNRAEAVRPAAEALGGTVENWWMAIGGEHDAVAIVSMPDDVSQAAFTMALMAGGAVREVRATQLLDADQSIQAMSMAGETGYEIPW